ncbi:MAG: hypothetical protein Q8R88_07035 [Desulfoprunum sp.]|nr:hypothetical protein [Desulfoprunum sp.]
MNEALILEKLDRLANDIQTLRTEVLQGMQQDAQPLQQNAVALANRPAIVPTGHDSNAELLGLVKELHTRINGLDNVLGGIKVGVEFVEDLDPVLKQALPKLIDFFHEIDGQFSVESLEVLFRRTLTNLDSLNEGLNLLKLGVELRDDMIPVAQLAYPKVLKFLNSLHEGEFQAEQIGTLLHTVLINLHTLSDLLNMLKPMTELIKELQVVVRETDVISNLNQWLDGLQNSSGIVKLAGTAAAVIRRIDCNETQVEEICKAISGIDLTRIEPVSPLGMFKLIRDPKIQEVMGAFVMIMQTFGSCLHSYQKEKKQQNGSVVN